MCFTLFRSIFAVFFVNLSFPLSARIHMLVGNMLWKVWKFWTIVRQHSVFLLLHYTSLTHWGLVINICIIKLNHHWFRLCLVACFPKAITWINAIYCQLPWEEIQWNLNGIKTFLSRKWINGYQGVCTMAAIVFQPHCFEKLIQC